MVIGVFILALAISDVHSRIGIRLMRLVGSGIPVFVSSILRFKVFCSGEVLTILGLVVDADRSRAATRGLVEVYEASVWILSFNPR